MNKKTLTAIVLILIMAFTAVIAFKSLEGIKDFDIQDPFEVDFDDE